jgi:AcrR family transcriptional regulator
VPPSRGPSRDLNRDEVVRIGIAIADAEGLGALSMRRIAADLGVSTMALYRYVGGKDALVLRMVDRAIGEFPFPAKQATDWREAIETAARLQWAAYRRHLWLASAVSLSRPQALPNLLPHTDAVLRALGPFGVDGSTALDTAITVFAYVRGVALAMEAEVQAEQDTGMTADEWADEHVGPIATMISLEDLAGFRAVFQPSFDFDYDLDRLFEFGLELLLDGLGNKLARLR